MKDLYRLLDLQKYSLVLKRAQESFSQMGNPDVLPLIALLHGLLGEVSSASKTLAQVDESQLGVNALVDLAGAEIVTNQWAVAYERLSKLVVTHPDHALLQARLAFCYRHESLYEKALDHIRCSLELEPHRIPVWIALAQLQLLLENPHRAQKALDSAQDQLEHQRYEFELEVASTLQSQVRELQLWIWAALNQSAEAEAWLGEPEMRHEPERYRGYLVAYSTALASHGRHAEAESILRNALSTQKDDIPLIIHWAELAKTQGRGLEAVNLLRKALSLASETEHLPVKIDLWIRLSEALLHILPEEANRMAIMALRELQNMQAHTAETTRQDLNRRARCALAEVQAFKGEDAKAEELYKAILIDQAHFLPALQGLGQVLLHRGRIDEAREVFERVQELDPAKGLASLIGINTIPEDEATLERIEKMARQPSLEGRLRPSALFALASAWEKKGRYEKALALAHEANAANRTFIRYNPKQHRQYCARVRHAFSRALFEHRTECGYRGKAESLPVFIVGMPRSGTSLVEQILAGHSRIFGAGELGIIPSRIQGLNRWERRVGSGRLYPDCVDDLTPAMVQELADGIIKEMLDLARNDKPHAERVIDKLPHNFENIGFIKFMFPKAKIISVRRDPRDTGLSNYFLDYLAKHSGMGFAYHLTWIGEQLADHNLLMQYWHQLFPGEIFEVHYEELIERTEPVSRELLRYLGLEWEPQVLEFGHLERAVKTASHWQVRQPIYQTSKKKWRHYKNDLSELIQGTNAKIEWDPICDMVSLPEPGWFTDAIALYEGNRLDEAELLFKKLLHHLPDHAAAQFMLGLILVRKGYLAEGVTRMELGFKTCPWNENWRQDLILANNLLGDQKRVEDLQNHKPMEALPPVPANSPPWTLQQLTNSQI